MIAREARKRALLNYFNKSESKKTERELLEALQPVALECYNELKKSNPRKEPDTAENTQEIHKYLSDIISSIHIDFPESVEQIIDDLTIKISDQAETATFDCIKNKNATTIQNQRYLSDLLGTLTTLTLVIKAEFFYKRATTIKINDKEAAGWFIKSANLSHIEAQYQLGLRYERGIGIERSEREAAKWFIKAAEQGHADANYTLGFYYKIGRGGLDEDKSLSVISNKEQRRIANSSMSFHWAAQKQSRGKPIASVMEKPYAKAALHLNLELGLDSKDEKGIITLPGLSPTKRSAPELKLTPELLQKEKENFLLNLRAEILKKDWGLRWGGGTLYYDPEYSKEPDSLTKLPEQAYKVVKEIDSLFGSFIAPKQTNQLFDNVLAIFKKTGARQGYKAGFFNLRSTDTNNSYVKYINQMGDLKNKLKEVEQPTQEQKISSHCSNR